MKTTLFLILFGISLNLSGQPYRKVGLAEVEKQLTSASDSLLIVNFWATWCKPCIEELPHFDSLVDRFPGQKIKVVLISVDFDTQEASLKRFLQRKKLQPEVWWLVSNENWIDAIHPEWSGALPATLVIQPGSPERHLQESAFTAETLDAWVRTFLHE
jgi:thiol-disulfide isomerase/thioredoxin